jgi:Fe-S cluster biosynthesis and repair protein YggX
MPMTEVDCRRCGSRAPGLERAPLPGTLGQQVLGQVCAGCWKDWMDTQVKLMNENRLSPAEPEHYALLVSEMRSFLSLREE